MNSNNFGVRSYAVKEVLLTFNLLSSKRVKRINSVFRTYYVLGRRAHYYLVNPNSVFDTFGRIFILFEGIGGEKREYSKWVFSFNVRYAAIARWFGWAIYANIFARLTKNNGILSNNGLILAVKGSMVAYTFLSYIGVDVAFVLSSRASGGRAQLLTQRSLLTIGFDGFDVWNYGYSLPGIRNVRTVLMFARIFVNIFGKVNF